MVRKAMMILAATGFVGTMVAATTANAQIGGFRDYGYSANGYGACPSIDDLDWGVYQGYRGCR